MNQGLLGAGGGWGRDHILLYCFHIRCRPIRDVVAFHTRNHLQDLGGGDPIDDERVFQKSLVKEHVPNVNRLKFGGIHSI